MNKMIIFLSCIVLFCTSVKAEVYLTLQGQPGLKISMSGKEQLWGLPGVPLMLGKQKDTTYILQITDPEILIFKGLGFSKELSVYVEPGDHLTITCNPQGGCVLKGDNELMERNRLLEKIQREQGRYTDWIYRARQSKGGEQMQNISPEGENKLQQMMERCNRLIAEQKIGMTKAFERYLQLDCKYYQMKQEVPMPNYLVKTYYNFPAADLKRIAQVIPDSRHYEAILSMYYRQMARAYTDYLRIRDPRKKMGPGEQYLENELKLGTYFKHKDVQHFIQAGNLAVIGYEHEGDSAFQAVAKQLPATWLPSLERFFKERSNYKGRTVTNAVEFPVISGVDTSGNPVNLKDFRGKWVFIDCWATWCGPCKFEMSYLKHLEHSLQGKPVVFVSISVDSEKERKGWIRKIREEKLKGVQLLCTDKADVFRQFGISGIPHFALINPDGKLVFNKMPKPSSGVSHHLLKAILK